MAIVNRFSKGSNDDTITTPFFEQPITIQHTQKTSSASASNMAVSYSDTFYSTITGEANFSIMGVSGGWSTPKQVMLSKGHKYRIRGQAYLANGSYLTEFLLQDISGDSPIYIDGLSKGSTSTGTAYAKVYFA